MADSLKKFGKYFLLDLLAQGGMAEIYRARHATPVGGGRLLAIKRIQQSYSANPEFINMFRGETKVTSSFTHPNIIQVYDYGEEQNQLYIAMEYVDGRNLRQFIARLGEMKNLFPPEVSCFVIEQSCLALQYAHEFKDKFTGKHLNIIHRDISPQNILISYDGAVKVIDFGIAKTETQSESTRAGVIKGKPSYLSPEQISGENLDGRSDVFALTIVFWEMLTGRKLFAGDNDLAVIRMIENAANHVKPPSMFNPKVPKELDAILLKGLEKDRAKRYQSAGEMQRAIHKFLYQFAPDFNPADLADYARGLFKNEIVEDRKRLHKLNEKAEELIQLGADQTNSNIAGSVPTLEAPEDTGVSMRRPSEGSTPAGVKAPARPAAAAVPPKAGAADPKDLPEMDLPAEDGPPPPPTAAKEKPALPKKPAGKNVISLNAEAEKSASNISLERVDPSTGSYSAGVVHNAKVGMPVAPSGTGSMTRRPPGERRPGARPAVAQASSSSSPLAKVALLAVLAGAGGYYYMTQMKGGTPEPSRSISATKTPPAPAADAAPAGGTAAPATAGQGADNGTAPLTANSVMLHLKIVPAGGQPRVKINGNPVTPLAGMKFPVPLDQPVILAVERASFEPYSKSVVFESARLAGMRDVPMEVELVPSHYGFLSVNTTPSAEAIIQIDGGEERVQTPFSGKRLPTGNYKIRLENKLLQMSKDIEVSIEENRVKKVEERLSVITDAH